MNFSRMALFSSLIVLAVAADAFGIPAQTVRVSLWRRGETIAGEEFLVANEQIIDYIGTLRRPTEGLKSIRYDCQVKSRAIQPTVQWTPAGQNSQWVTVRMVYELRDCAEVP